MKSFICGIGRWLLLMPWIATMDDGCARMEQFKSAVGLAAQRVPMSRSILADNRSTLVIPEK